MKRLVYALYHLCCRHGLGIVWVSMIGGMCPHRSRWSLAYAWMPTSDEIHCGLVRPGPWIVWIPTIDEFDPRCRRGRWIV